MVIPTAQLAHKQDDEDVIFRHKNFQVKTALKKIEEVNNLLQLYMPEIDNNLHVVLLGGNTKYLVGKPIGQITVCKRLLEEVIEKLERLNDLVKKDGT